jgi:hypothetical protein
MSSKANEAAFVFQVDWTLRLEAPRYNRNNMSMSCLSFDVGTSMEGDATGAQASD